MSELMERCLSYAKSDGSTVALKTFADIQLWKESLASCSIENNEYAERMLELMKSDSPKDQWEWWQEFQNWRQEDE